MDRGSRLARRGDVPVGHLAQLSSVRPAQIYLIIAAVQAKADCLVGLGLVEVIDQGHGYAPHFYSFALGGLRPRLRTDSGHACSRPGGWCCSQASSGNGRPLISDACHLDLPLVTMRVTA